MVDGFCGNHGEKGGDAGANVEIKAHTGHSVQSRGNKMIRNTKQNEFLTTRRVCMRSTCPKKKKNTAFENSVERKMNNGDVCNGIVSRAIKAIYFCA